MSAVRTVRTLLTRNAQSTRRPSTPRRVTHSTEAGSLARRQAGRQAGRQAERGRARRRRGARALAAESRARPRSGTASFLRGLFSCSFLSRRRSSQPGSRRASVQCFLKGRRVAVPSSVGASPENGGDDDTFSRP